MIDFTRSELTQFVIHYVGNKGLGEELTLSEKQIEISDDFLKDTVMKYLTSPFKTDIYYQFKSKNEMHYLFFIMCHISSRQYQRDGRDARII